MSDRRRVQQLKEELGSTTEENSRVSEASDDAKMQAAIKIQSRARGMNDRKRVQELKGAGKETPSKGEGAGDKEAEAAIKIQSRARGMEARKRVTEIKAGQGSSESSS